MTQLDAIWNRARTDLVIVSEQGDLDVFLWEHSVRVAQNAQQIATLPIVKEQSPDELTVVAAGLYHDADLAVRVRNGEIAPYEIHVRPPAQNHREQSSLVMERSLAKLLPPDSLKRALEVVRTLHDRDVTLIEGRIVAEAENLDEFGLLSLWPTIRRGAMEGKGVQAVIDTWQKKMEYHFWTARLDDSFRFAPVRAIAKKRLERFEQVMTDLQEQQQGADITMARASLRRERAKKRTTNRRTTPLSPGADLPADPGR